MKLFLIFFVLSGVLGGTLEKKLEKKALKQKLKRGKIPRNKVAKVVRQRQKAAKSPKDILQRQQTTSPPKLPQMTIIEKFVELPDPIIEALIQKEKINTKTNMRTETANLQHCYKCQVTISEHDPDLGATDVWKKCMQTGLLIECRGDDKACETVERRTDNKVHMVSMGCKQRSSCITNVPDWNMNSGECRPEIIRGNSKCSHCCDNTIPSVNRGCNLDGWDTRNQGLQKNWNVTMDFSDYGPNH